MEDGAPRLGEVLVRMRCLAMGDVDDALRTAPKGTRLGEHLVHLAKLTEENLYQALSMQAGIPLGAPALEEISLLATRMIPAATSRRWRVMPYRVGLGQLHLLTTEVPSEQMTRELSEVSTLELRFRLVKPLEFEQLVLQYR